MTNASHRCLPALRFLRNATTMQCYDNVSLRLVSFFSRVIRL